MIWRGLLLAAAALLVIIAALGLVEYIRIQGLTQSVRERLSRLQEAMTSPSLMLPSSGLSALRADMDGAETDLTALKDVAERYGPLVPGWLPEAQELRQAPPVLELGLDVVHAGQYTLAGLNPLAQALTRRQLSRISLSTFDADMASALEAGAPQFTLAQKAMQQARAARRGIDASTLPPGLAAAVSAVDAASPRLDASLKLATAGPALSRTLLGLDRPRSFLILAQNTQELRPTGGFLSGVWLVTVDKSKVTRLDFFNSSDVDDRLVRAPVPPRSLVITLWGGIWTFRDSNWAADFPTAASQARELYRRGQGETVDGVIAVDEVAVRNLVEALGSITLQYTGERVDPSNIQQKLEYGMSSRFWSPPESPTLPPKKVLMKGLFESILLRMNQGLSFTEGGKVVRSVLQNMEDKHLIMDMDDQPLKALLRDHQWDGAVVKGDGDFLLVTDTNVGFNKVNGAVTERLDYRVIIDDNAQATAQLTITYTNTSRKTLTTCQQQATFVSDYKEWQEGCYWDFLRTYVPEGSRLLGTSFVPIPEGSMVARFGPEMANTWNVVGAVQWGKQEFMHFFVIPPGQTRQIRFEYALPATVVRREGDRWTYALFVEKQPGTKEIPLTLTIVAPSSMLPTVWAPYMSPVTANPVRLAANLNTNKEFHIAIARR